MNRGMRTTLQLACAILILLAGCAPHPLPTPTEESTSSFPECRSDAWSILKTTHFGAPTLAVMFRDSSFGIATDLGGRIYYSEDGGETWTYTAASGFSRVALEMNGDFIWHVGYGGALTRSSDNARHWEALSILPHTAHLEYISFADEKTGWVVTTELNEYFVTHDGGQTWERWRFPEGMGRPAALHLRTANDGYLLDTAGQLFVTGDGGQTWETRSLSLKHYQTIPPLNHSAAMRFIDENNGLVALNLLSDGQGKVLALRTTDGGLSWSQETLPIPMGMFHLTRDGIYLTHVDLLDHGKITLLCHK